jgi:hypothetical protein
VIILDELLLLFDVDTSFTFFLSFFLSYFNSFFDFFFDFFFLPSSISLFSTFFLFCPDDFSLLLCRIQAQKGREPPGFLSSQIFYSEIISHVDKWRSLVEVRKQCVSLTGGDEEPSSFLLSLLLPSSSSPSSLPPSPLPPSCSSLPFVQTCLCDLEALSLRIVRDLADTSLGDLPNLAGAVKDIAACSVQTFY